MIPETVRPIPLLNPSTCDIIVDAKKGLKTKEKHITTAIYTENCKRMATSMVGQFFLHFPMANLLKSLSFIL